MFGKSAWRHSTRRHPNRMNYRAAEAPSGGSHSTRSAMSPRNTVSDAGSATGTKGSHYSHGFRRPSRCMTSRSAEPGRL